MPTDPGRSAYPKDPQPPAEAGRVVPLTPERRKEVDELWEEATPVEDVLERRRSMRRRPER
jgi:hypothetical protein